MRVFSQMSVESDLCPGEHHSSPTEACVCCRNIVLLFSLLVLLVEGDLDSNGETCQVKPLERLLFWLMTQQFIWYNVSVFADVGIQAMSTGKQEVCQHTRFTVSLSVSSHLSLCSPISLCLTCLSLCSPVSLCLTCLTLCSPVSLSVLPIKIKTPHLMKPPQVSCHRTDSLVNVTNGWFFFFFYFHSIIKCLDHWLHIKMADIAKNTPLPLYIDADGIWPNWKLKCTLRHRQPLPARIITHTIIIIIRSHFVSEFDKTDRSCHSNYDIKLQSTV